MQVELSFLPPSSAVEQAEIHDALAAYEVATREERDADRAFVQLQRRRGQAETLDAEQTADAIAKGKADPGPKNATKYERDLADAQRQAAARKVVLDRARRAVVEAFEQHGDSLREQVAERFERVRSEYVGRLDALIDAHRALVAEFRMHAFVDADNGGRFRPSAKFAAVDMVPVPHDRLQDDTTLFVTDVFSLLAAVGAPPKLPEGLNPAFYAAQRGEDVTRPLHRPLSQQGVTGTIGVPGQQPIEAP